MVVYGTCMQLRLYKLNDCLVPITLFDNDEILSDMCNVWRLFIIIIVMDKPFMVYI